MEVVLLNVELFELVGIIPDFEYPLLKAFWSVLSRFRSEEIF